MSEFLRSTIVIDGVHQRWETPLFPSWRKRVMGEFEGNEYQCALQLIREFHQVDFTEEQVVKCSLRS